MQKKTHRMAYVNEDGSITNDMNNHNNKREPADPGSLHWIGSAEEIGYEDHSDICTKHRVWWMRMTNNQLRQIADIRVTTNPFPRPGESHYCGHTADVKTCDGLDYVTEQRIYAAAVLEAGKWLGKMIER